MKKKGINVYEIIRFTSFGLLISGPFLKYWWYALDLKILGNPKIYLKPVKMMIIDQMTSPFILNALCIGYLSQLHGHTINQSIESVKTGLWPIVKESYKIWPLATLINFYLVPLHNRIIFSNIVGLIWSIYFSYLINKQHV